MRNTTWLIFVFASLLSLSVSAQEQSGLDIPEPLRAWIPWVLHGHENQKCPWLGQEGEDDARACAWPSELTIQVSERGAQFSMPWVLYARSRVNLPGDESRWPQFVRANGVAVPVIMFEGKPIVQLEPGAWTLTGQWTWSSRPEAISIPSQVALINLVIDGKTVFPLERDDNQLWLGQAESAVREADTSEIKVFRLLTDVVPAMLETRIQLRISGEGREEVLPPALPEGFAPISLSSELTARIESDGKLRVQVRPGSYEIKLVARATSPLFKVTRNKAAAPWPEQEIWSYQSVQRLRVSEVTHVSLIDPVQAGVPSEWASLPSFLMERESQLVVAERSRGLSAQDANRLHLTRQMWLDFSGQSWTTRDQISGTMTRDWRLDVASPFELKHAETDARGLLVTRGNEPDLTGVELREPQLRLSAATRMNTTSASVPVTGWKHTFDGIDTTLNLPPGYRLYAALGADQAPGAWIMQWDLLDIFWVSLWVLMAFWLHRWLGAGVVLVYALLAFHEASAPLLSVMLVLLLGLFLKWLPPGRFATTVRWGKAAALLIVILWSLPFAADQMRLAFHPQLEKTDAFSSDGYFEGSLARSRNSEAPPLPAYDQAVPAAEAPMPQKQVEANLKSVEVTGSGSAISNIGRNQALVVGKQYATNTLIQAGVGNPSWSWNTYQLSWSGPVNADQHVRLIIAPPWLTSLLRGLTVILLLTLIAQLARGSFSSNLRFSKLATALVLSCAFMAQAQAQSWPSEDMLEELSKRLITLPECAPTCSKLARAEINADKDQINLALEFHVAASVAVPLPSAEKSVLLESLKVDGTIQSSLLRREEGQWWVFLERGVHRVDMVLRAAQVEKVPLKFKMLPAYLNVSAVTWDANGVRDNVLLTDTLELVRVRVQDAQALVTSNQDFQPYVKVTRQLIFDLDWQIHTTVERVAPEEAGFSIDLPLLKGERVISNAFKVHDEKITVALQAHESAVSWDSQLEHAGELTLTAPELNGRAETWQLSASPMWNLNYSGVPAVYAENPSLWIHEFHPLPEEKLNIKLTRPEAVGGATVAIDAASLRTVVGKRASEHQLQFELRSTQGGQHVIDLPEAIEVLSVTLAGEKLNVRPDKGRLSLPIKPGSQQIDIHWRQNNAISLSSRTPEVGLNAAASNLKISLELPHDRWLLATGGPIVGPAVLYWPMLAILGLLAFGLSRSGRTPLKFRDWLLLGFGFSMFSWIGLVLVIGWLLALDARAPMSKDLNPNVFNVMQITLVALTFLALVSLIANVQQGLLGHPDMHVVGNGSNAFVLNWFYDQTDRAFPQAVGYSVSIWWYKTAILLWALWLVNALTRWLRWGLGCYATHGYWRTVSTSKPAAAAKKTPPPASEEVAKAVQSNVNQPPPKT
jgi:hypothetical protein